MKQLLILLVGLVTVSARDLDIKSVIDNEQYTEINKLLHLLANSENSNKAVLKSSNKRDYSNVTRGLSDRLLDTRSGCPSMWNENNGYCYARVGTALNFREAQSYCRRMNSDVASIMNSDESDYIKRMYDGWWLWVGTSNEDQNDWHWIDSGNAIQFNDWASGEPNNAPPGEHCAVLDGTNTIKWLDVPCSFEFRFICKKRL